MKKLEVIAVTLEDALRAQAGGASSVEIVENMALGGLTPPLNVVSAIRDSVALHTRVMVRPHADSFVYSSADQDAIFTEIEALLAIGVGGIVFGALREDSTVDLDLMRRVAHAAQPLEVTLHRAIDICRDPLHALSDLEGIVQRVLTSGQAETVWEGRETIRAWINQYSTSYTFACGGGVRLEGLRDLVSETDAPEYHIGGAARTDDHVDSDKVRAVLEIINS